MGETKLKAQVSATAQEQVEAGLAGKVAKDAQKALVLKMAEMRARANLQIDKEMEKETKVNKGSERGYFSLSVALDKVQGYWARRRRFVREKKFVTHGSLLQKVRSPEEEKEDQVQAQELVKTQKASEVSRIKALRAKRMSEIMKELLPEGSVQNLVKKLA